MFARYGIEARSKWDFIEKIRNNCSDEQKKEISNILKSLYNITKE